MESDIIKAIVAFDKNYGIGHGNDLLAYLPKDLKRFKEITKNNVVIMGRKTLESLPNGEPLKDRINIVLTRDKSFTKEGVIVMHSIDYLLAYMWILEVLNGVEVFIIGGQEIYEQLIPHCTALYVTKIHHKFKADKHFPNLDKLNDWKITEESEIHNEGDLDYQYLTYERVE